MFDRIVLPVLLAGTIATGVTMELLPAAPAGAGNESTGESDAVAQAAASTSRTAKAVKAANAFKASLTSSQRSTLQFSFNSSRKKTGWSNFPVSFVKRNGVAIEDMSSSQVAKLRALLKTILSSQGYKDEEAIRKADEYLGARANGYGQELYYVAFFGTPSTAKKWTVQFGGHHLAIHMTFSGKKISSTPYFFAVEPRGSFTQDGKSYAPMADEEANLFGAVQALDSTQLATAKLSQSFDDILVGPQKDGQFPSRTGITVSELSSAQQAKVTAAIKSYLHDMPTTRANALLKTYRAAYSETKLAWSGSTDPSVRGGYVRIHGPRVWIEDSVQNGIVLSGVHHHSIERDIKTDYGAGT